MSAQADITGVLKRVLFRADDGWSIAQLENPSGATFVAKGHLGPYEPGETLELRGQWTKSRWGRDLVVESVIPAEEAGIEAFLRLLPGVGPARARMLRERFGERIWETIEENPEGLREIVPGLTDEKLANLQKIYATRRNRRDLIIWLRGLGVGPHHTSLIIAHFGDDACVIVRADPYRLVDVDGIGFRTADTIALKAGTPPDSSRRVEEAIRHVLKEIERSDGSTCCDGGILMACLGGYDRGPGGVAPPVKLDPAVSRDQSYAVLKRMRSRLEIHLEGRLVQLAETRTCETEVADAIAARAS